MADGGAETFDQRGQWVNPVAARRISGRNRR